MVPRARFGSARNDWAACKSVLGNRSREQKAGNAGHGDGLSRNGLPEVSSGRPRRGRIIKYGVQLQAREVECDRCGDAFRRLQTVLSAGLGDSDLLVFRYILRTPSLTRAHDVSLPL
jgi:hypothetical protein